MRNVAKISPSKGSTSETKHHAWNLKRTREHQWTVLCPIKIWFNSVFWSEKMGRLFRPMKNGQGNCWTWISQFPRRSSRAHTISISKIMPTLNVKRFWLRHFAYPSPNFKVILHEWEKCEIWRQFSNPVQFKALWFRNRTKYLSWNWKVLWEHDGWSICSPIWFRWFPTLRNRQYKIAILKSVREN